jgi:putative peptidoglycan lipid II flippase
MPLRNHSSVVSEPSKPARSLINIAGIVAVATLISKVFGMVRQIAIAAAFGVGAAVDAYNYAYVVPGFLFVLLGGINGPFHSSIISVLSKRPKEDAAPLIETITTLVGLVLVLLTVGLMIFAAPLVYMLAPGATADVQAITVEQFRIMAPMALFSGLIGIGFGTLNAADQYWLPAISPLFSSITVIIGVWFFRDQYGPAVLAWGTLAGAVLQWLVQIPAQWQSGMGTLRLRFEFNRPGVSEIWRLMGPATLSSGMLLISVYISLFFASLLPVGAASALGYAQLLFLTPLGILSNVVLVPLMPIFSRLAAPENWTEFKHYLRQGLIITAITMLPLGALISALALPAVRLIYEYAAFGAEDSRIVASVLLAYGVGMFFYLGRDVLVRAFYGLGDGKTPLVVSLWGLAFNAIFCFLFTQTFGAAGLALATAGVNVASMTILLWVLHKRLNGLPWRETGLPILGLAGGSLMAGVAAWGALMGCQALWGAEGKLLIALQLAIAGAVGLGIFAIVTWQLKIPEVKMLTTRLLERFQK